MEDPIEIFLDAVMTFIVLAACLPVFMFVCNTFMYDSNFGFGSLDEKSVAATDAQLRDLGISTITGDYVYIDDKKIWTNGHYALLEAVESSTDIRRDVSAGTGSYSYTLSYANMLDKKARLDSGYSAASSIAGGNYGGAIYHISIDSEGTIAFKTNREEVN